MLSVDNRAGSAPLIPMLRKLGLEIESVILDSGDISFLGFAHGGAPVSVGIECKTLGDCLSCVTSGRLAGSQLPKMLQSYDHLYLLIQGEWRIGRNGELLERREGRGGGQYWTEAGGGQRRWMWRDFEGWVNSIGILGGMRVHRVPTWDEGCQWVKCLYSWYQRKEHSSVQVVYGSKELFADHALLVKPTLARRVAAQLPLIAEKRSADVARRFPTLEKMVNASEREWMDIDGVGRGIAKKIYSAIHGLNGNGNGGKGHG